jgi:Apea-like HEPN
MWKFHVDGDVPFRLSRQISIRKLTRKEQAETEFHVGFMLAQIPRFCIQCVSRRTNVSDWDNGEAQAEKVIEAMRLFSSGDVGAFVSVSFLGLGMSRIALTTNLVTDREGETYRMDRNAREDFIRFWAEYLAWKPKAALSRHLHRFMKAYANTDWRDRLVDFVTSMEGLVLPNEFQELSKQFALRIAWLLGTTRGEREAIFDKARRVYQERSKVVHGQADVTSAKNLSLCHSAEEMNRRLLVHSMRHPEHFTAENLNKLLLGV